MIIKGMTGTAELTVSDRDTAIALGSGDLSVLGTPRVVALCEEAAVAVLAGLLPPGATSVGTQIQIDHTAASAVGASVTAKATVLGVESKKITFDVELVDRDSVVASGTHTRFIVDHDQFLRSV